MTRLTAAAALTLAVLLPGCGAHPAAPAASRVATRATVKYLVFYIKEARTTPAPAGAPFKFSRVDLVGHGDPSGTDPAIHLSATLSVVDGKVQVAMTREGKPMTDDERGFYTSQLRNNLIMGGLEGKLRDAVQAVADALGRPF